MDSGDLFFDYNVFELQPRFLFQSGNIAIKLQSLKDNKDKYIEHQRKCNRNNT